MHTIRFTLACLLASPLAAQLAITEVLADPVGPNLGNQQIEVVNVSGAPFTPLGWNFCSFPHYFPLPAITLPAGAVVRVHLAAAGVDTGTDWFVPTFPELPLVSAIQLFRSGIFTNDSDIVDHVSWGGTGPRANQAANIGQWPSATAFVPVPVVEGHSIAFDGTGNSPSDWYADATPTLGRANGTANVVTQGTACATSLGLPTLSLPSPAVDGNLDFRVTISGGAPGSNAGVLLGIPTPALPVFGCELRVNPFVTVTGQLSPTGTLSIPIALIGANPVAGLTLGAQALVLDIGAPNGLFGASSGVTFTIGN